MINVLGDAIGCAIVAKLSKKELEMIAPIPTDGMIEEKSDDNHIV